MTSLCYSVAADGPHHSRFYFAPIVLVLCHLALFTQWPLMAQFTTIGTFCNKRTFAPFASHTPQLFRLTTLQLFRLTTLQLFRLTTLQLFGLMASLPGNR
jgi:hypothetical protein